MGVITRLKARMLNRRASLPGFKADEIIDVLDIRQGAVIADIGSGGGYFTFLLAEKVGPAGRVFAVDTDAKLLGFIVDQANRRGLTNIETVLIRGDDLGLEGRGCELVFFRNVFHHIEQPESYFRDLKRVLRPSSRVVIIDYRKPARRSSLPWPRHYADEEFIHETMRDAGYIPIDRHDFLPEQSFNVFKPASS